MATKLGTAVLYLLGDDSHLKESLKGTEKTFMSTLGNVGKAAAGLAVGAIAAVGVGLTAALKASIDEAQKAELVQAQLGAVLKSTGGISGMTADSINALALSLSEVTRFEDDAIVSGQNMLLTFTNIGKDIFPQATEAMLNMSTAMGMDMQSAATMLGKALNDPVAGLTALGRAGVQFSDDQKAAIKAMVEAGDVAGAQAIILKELETQFGGAARAAGGTFAGQMDILNNALGNVKEEIGMALLPVLTDLIKEYGPQLIAFAKDAAKWIVSDLVPAIKTTAEWIADELIPAITLVVEWIVVNLVPAIQDLAKWIQTDLIPAIVTVVKWLVENLGPIIQDVARWIQTDFIPAVQAIVQWLSVNLPPAIEFAGRVFNDLKARIDGITSAIRTAIQWVSDLIERLRNLRMPSLNLGGLGLNGLNGAQGFGGAGAFGGLGMQAQAATAGSGPTTSRSTRRAAIRKRSRRRCSTGWQRPAPEGCADALRPLSVRLAGAARLQRGERRFDRAGRAGVPRSAGRRGVRRAGHGACQAAHHAAEQTVHARRHGHDRHAHAIQRAARQDRSARPALAAMGCRAV